MYVYVTTMYHIHGENKHKPYEIFLELCNETCKFEIDTGAARSILSDGTFNKLRDRVDLRCSKAVLSTYTAERTYNNNSLLNSLAVTY